jgi:hypothetical protein
MAQSGRVRIRVADATGRAISSAEASLSGANGNTISTGRSDEAGEIVLTGIPFGYSQIRVTHSGFKPFLLTRIPILNADELKLEFKLEVGEPIIDAFPEKKRKHWWIFH